MNRVRKILENEKGVSPVIAVILMVAITVVLAAVLYVMVTGLIGGGGQAKPVVSFTQTRIESGTVIIDIADIDRQFTLDNFGMLLRNDSNAVGSQDPIVSGPPGATSGNATVTFEDLPGDGQGYVSAGDRFTMTGFRVSSSYELTLLYRGDSIRSQTY